MNIGIVGLGYWGRKVIDEYATLRDEGLIQRVDGCDVNESQLAGIEVVDETYTTIDSLLSNVDAVHICTNNQTHFEIATAAMERDVDVIVEKPLTTDRELAFDMVEKASETGQILQTGHIFRFANVVRTIKELYEDGYFGKDYYFNIAWTHRIEPRSDGNVLWDLLPHPLDILNFVTGQWPTHFSGTVESYRNEGVSDTASVHLFGDSIEANIQVSWVDPVRRRLLQIVGSDRSAYASCTEQTLQIYENGGAHDYEVEVNNTIRAEAENFIRSIETRENTFNSAIVGARAVDTIQRIHDEIE